ncbi:type II toxin-antitoxin system YhaV family toxin, partial [Neisseria gonorrhoeae]
YGGKNDAYTVFKKMLGNGNPPSDWTALLEVVSKE